MKSLATLAATAALSLGSAAAQIETVDLDDSAFALGALTPRTGALPADLWEGADADTVAGLLAALPDRFAEPAYLDLARRVLLSPGEGPEGAGNALAGAKLLAAARLGFYRDAAGLAEIAPGLRTEAALSEVVAYAALLDGDMAEACARGANLRVGRQDPFWLKLRFLCYVENDEGPAADLTLGLLRDQDALTEGDDRLFTALLAGGGAQTAVSPANAFQYAAARMAGMPVAPAALGEAPGALVTAIARDAAATSSLRADAIERALALGLLQGEEARTLVSQLGNNALAEEVATVIERDQGSLDQATALAESLRAASGWDAYRARAALFADIVEETRPTLGYAPFAGEFALAAMANGQGGAAQRWLRAVLADGTDSTTPLPPEDLLRLYSVLDPDAAERLAERAQLTVEPVPPTLLFADEAAQAGTDLAGLLELALSAAHSGSSGAAALAALTGLGTEATEETEAFRTTLVEVMLRQSGHADSIARRLSFDELAAAAVGQGTDETQDDPAEAETGEPVPRLKPEGQ
ncbi:hypothetical protein [Parvularcula oceani]|uniref:hypothetical protein n=1 Tax=Parvularcula oceani TaxID=1247963 RepID=UPI0004E149F6|nr:hypothetical protein [Parvularcula oceani]